MIRTIIFDNGGVLVGDGWQDFITDIETEYGQEAGAIEAKINQIGKAASRGQVSFGDLVDYVKELTGVDEELLNKYGPHQLNEEIVKYIQELKNDYEVALLTNEIGSFDHDNKIWHMEEIFGENIFCSSKIGHIKPEPEIYLYTLEKLGRKPEEVIFIDDREKNLAGARNVGMNVLQFISIEDLKQKLKEMLNDKNNSI